MTTSRQLAIGALLIGSSFLAADLGAALGPERVAFETAMQPVMQLGLAPALLAVPAPPQDETVLSEAEGAERPELHRPPAHPAPPILTRAEAQALLDDPGLPELVRVHPVEVGVRLEFLHPSHALAWMGLQDGDVLLAMNGRPLLDPEDLHRPLEDPSAVSWQVQRGGQAFEARYEFAR